MSVPHHLLYCELGQEEGGRRGREEGGGREEGEGGRRREREEGGRRERRGKEGEGSVPHCL